MLDENSTELLKNQLQKTQKEIEDLGPSVKSLEDNFQVKMKKFEPTFVFYQTRGMEAYFKTLSLSNSLIDLLTFQKLAEEKLNEDLHELEDMYTEYLPLKVQHDSLVSYRKLLDILGENLARREQIMSKFGNDPDSKEVSEEVSEIWTQNIGYLLELQEDGKVINDNINNLVRQATNDSPYRLEEGSINEITALDYYIRADHVYIHLEREKAHLVLVARFLKEDKKIRLDVETGFINGFLIPEDLLGILKGYEIDYSLINEDSADFHFEQTNGALIIQPVEAQKD